jgi:hypothetical protein
VLVQGLTLLLFDLIFFSNFLWSIVMPNSPILDGLDRPDSPNHWTRTDWKIQDARAAGLFPPPAPVNPTNGNLAYDFTWHHNIPWKTLRDSFKVAIVFCEWDVVEMLLDLYGMRLNPLVKRRIKLTKEAIGPTAQNASGATYEKWVNRFSGGGESHLGNLSVEKQLTNWQVDEIAQGVAWQRWNIVEGPKESIRVEDPGSDGFDDFSRADPAHINRYMAIEDLYHALVDITADYEARKANFASFNHMTGVWSLKLRGPVRNAQFLINQPLVMFNPSHWRVMHWGGQALTKNLSGKVYYQVRTRRTDDL